MANSSILQEKLEATFMRKLFATPAGRAHLFNQAADAEGSDESELFDRLATFVDDPKLAQMVRRHQADEKEHEQLFLGCLARTGVKPPPVPDHLKLLKRIDRALGRANGEAPPVKTRRDVMETYLLLQVLEERATNQFKLFAKHLRPVDPESADVILRINADEERHLRYCHAIARRYAPSATIHQRTLDEYRALEVKCFAENTRANVQYLFGTGVLEASAPERMFWIGLGKVTRAMGLERKTSYWGEKIATPKVETVESLAA